MERSGARALGISTLERCSAPAAVLRVLRVDLLMSSDQGVIQGSDSLTLSKESDPRTRSLALEPLFKESDPLIGDALEPSRISSIGPDTRGPRIASRARPLRPLRPALQFRFSLAYRITER